MTEKTEHITVCICTYKRPELLSRLLHDLNHQNTNKMFNYSIVVVDNDRDLSARNSVNSFIDSSDIEIKYCVEPEQSISLARNRVVENSKGDFVAFIDDDEYPVSDWLLNLYRAYHEFKADGILGPVLPYYATKPPHWVEKGKFHERPSHKTGTVLSWTNTRTGNVLLRRNIFDCKDNMFNPEFGSGGEDRDFFRRMISKGCKFVWCAEAQVYEVVPPERFKRSFMVRRALLRGTTPYNHTVVAYLTSLVAIPLYTLLLPLLFFIRHHLFMKYLVSYFDHIGRMSYLFNIKLIKEKYILE